MARKSIDTSRHFINQHSKLYFVYANNLGDKMINRSKKRITKKVKRVVTLQGEKGDCVQDGTSESLSMANKVLIPNLGNSFTRWLHYNLFGKTLFYVFPVFLLHSQEDILKTTFRRGCTYVPSLVVNVVLSCSPK